MRTLLRSVLPVGLAAAMLVISGLLVGCSTHRSGQFAHKPVTIPPPPPPPPPSSRGQEASATTNSTPPSWLLTQQVSIECRFLRVPREIANELLGEALVQGRITLLSEETLQRLRQLETFKRVTVVGQPRVTTVSGNTAQVKSVTELRYVADYNPQDEMPVVETREVGSLLNVTPTIYPDGKIINLTLVPEHCTVVKPFRTIEIILPRSGRTVTLDVPQFISKQVTTTVTLSSGSTVLLGVFDPTEEEGPEAQNSVVLCLLSATIDHGE